MLRCAVVTVALVASLAHGEEPAPQDAAAPDNSAPEPERKPITSTSGTAPSETLKERMERFKREKGAGSDRPFDGFATQAERDMQAQREAAIGGSPDGVRTAEERKQWSSNAEMRALEQELLEDSLEQLAATWGASGCFPEEPDWNAQDNIIKHRKLTRNDFLSEKEQKVQMAANVPGAQVGAYVALQFSCVVKSKITPLEDGRHQAEVTHARYFALLSRNESYWAPQSDGNLAYVLGHEQIHFDIAEAFARHLTSLEDKIRARMISVGKTPEEAIGRLQLQWGQHMKLVQEDFERIETAYDRETKHGILLDKQTEWKWRSEDGFEAIAKGIKLASLKGLR
jgi:hypothetical protein